MAVSIDELIQKKEELANRKKRQFDLQTSAGAMTVKLPTRALIAEATDLETGSDDYILMNTIVAPDLSDKNLQKAYGCVEPTDIIGKIFDAGEIVQMVRKIMELAGWRQDIQADLHEEVKN